MGKMRAVVVDPGAPGRLAIQEVDEPSPGPHQALVRVFATSLNLGEVKGAQSSAEGTRPGWDLAGIVESAAADGSGPAEGARVVGHLPSGAWAELVAVPTRSMAQLPDGVSFAQAATLPVAGMTALHAVEHGTGLLGRKVLITGASGGVGHFACQLAKLSGADVIALIHNPGKEAVAREAGAEQVVSGEDAAPAARYGPYRLIVDGVGGAVLSKVVGMLAPDGVCVAYGATAGAEIGFTLWSLAQAGRASLYGLMLFKELELQPASEGLARLSHLVATGRLRPHIGVEAPWDRFGKVAQDLLDRRIAGKAVLLMASQQ